MSCSTSSAKVLAWTQSVTSSSDPVSDSRWPVWGQRVGSEVGVLAMLCFQLFIDDKSLGALNLYSCHVDGFSAEDQEEGRC